jgi:SP family xylose:H+ symportor-like MFS transporter
VWGIAAVAAIGGFLFGDDWVVIGGAKPFYESYFGLHTAAQIGWANSCALVGCFAGALAAGSVARRFGRRPVLLLAALLFAFSSVFTGWAHLFSGFVFWRIAGGVAIGLASNISPVYIAEVSPALWRGRLIALNQLTLVCGILAAQIVNWQIARPVPAHLSSAAVFVTWNVQYGWRWMFTAVALPAVIFFCLAFLIPESPRWLVSKSRSVQAAQVLTRIGGPAYAAAEVEAISSSVLSGGKGTASEAWRLLRRPGLRGLLLLGIGLAVLQQWSGINILFNYAQEVFESAGYGTNQILFNIVITGAINLLFTLLAMLIVDRVRRRTLMIIGCIGVGLAHLAASAAYHERLHGTGVLLLTLLAIAFYAATLAPLTWILIAELFPNSTRDLAVSIAVAALWLSSFALTYSFPLLEAALTMSGVFVLYGVICLAGAWMVKAFVPETRGVSLESMGSLAQHAPSQTRS